MIDFTPAGEPLGHSAPLHQRARLPLLGLPLEIRSNSAAVIAAAERSFGHWRGLEPELIEATEPLIVTIVVHPPAGSHAAQAARRLLKLNTQHSTPNTQFTQRAHGSCFLAASGANLLTAQMDRGVALGFVTPELVADDLALRYHVIECLALLLASWRDRTPVHAGAVVHAGRAVLLVGTSTAGKSTLCYACLRAGLQLLAEDVVYVGLRGGLRLWGNPRSIHLLPDARRLFPELADCTPEIQANGKRKLAIDVAAFGADRVRRYADRAAVCLIQRHAGQASAIEPIDPQDAADAIARQREAGFDLHQGAPAVAAALSERGAYRLHLGRALDQAVALLRQLAAAHEE